MSTHEALIGTEASLALFGPFILMLTLNDIADFIAWTVLTAAVGCMIAGLWMGVLA